MTSRLDRLFVLLEAGAGAATRRAAARQLGEIQRAHPEELHRLLGRLMRHLRAPAWETRTAAAQAVEAILSNVPEWQPPPLAGIKEEKLEDEGPRLRCETFDLENVLRHGAHLMGSEGREYELEDEPMGAAQAKELAARQRSQLNAQLGLDVAARLGVDLSSVYTAEDLCAPRSPQVKIESARRPVQEVILVPAKQLSSREMNLAKRKARQAFCKQKSRDEDAAAPPTPPCEPIIKKMKLETTDDCFLFPPPEGAPLAVPDNTGGWSPSARWPLWGWCSALQAQLFSAAWEARHGAATALRELLRADVAKSAGCKAGMSEEQMEEAHQDWLEDMALRLLCVLALDRFGDFVSDQVVAPVRETCAQTLGVCVAALASARASRAAALLATLAQHSQWEARHGALLGFKYLLAARQDVACASGALEHLIAGLDDSAEDVSAVAAGALAPAATALANARPMAVPGVVARLWQLLHDQDELAAPANSYMALLAALMALPKAAKLLHPIDLTDVLPRLWPYLDHSTSSVRKATLQTMRTLTRPLVINDPTETNTTNQTGPITNGSDHKTAVSDSDSASETPIENSEVKNSVEVNGVDQYLNWTPELLQEAMRHVYQRVLFEHVEEIQDIALQVWENLLRHSALATILVAACPALATWLCLAMQPARLPLDPALLLHKPHKERRGRPPTTGGPPPPIDSEAPRPVARWLLGGGEALPAAQRDANVTRARCRTAMMLGYLSCYLVQPAPGIEYKAEDESPIDCYVKVMVVYLRSGSALQRLVASLVISWWAQYTEERGLFPPKRHPADPAGTEVIKDVAELAPPLLTATIHTALNQALYYDEVALNCNRILQEARDLHAMMKHYKLPVDGEEFNNILRLEQVVQLTVCSQPLVSGLKTKRVACTLDGRRRALQAAASACRGEQNALHVEVQAALAGACAHLHALPLTLNPVVRPLMESVKRSPAEQLQRRAADALAALLAQRVGREPCPNNKVLVNLKAFLRCDPSHTPRISLESGAEDEGSGSDSGNDHAREKHATVDRLDGILTLRSQAAAERAPRRGRPPASPAASTTSAALQLETMFGNEDESRQQVAIQRRGATLALTRLSQHFADALPTALPKLWEFITQPLERVLTDAELEALEVEPAEELISRLQVLETVCSAIGPGLWDAVAGKASGGPGGPNGATPNGETSGPSGTKETGGASALAALCRAPYTALRHMAARALAAMAARDPCRIMQTVIHEVLPVLTGEGPGAAARARCGAAEAVWRVLDALQLHLVPYIVLLVVPLLGRMSDHCEAVRIMSTRCFATLIQLMPLDGAVPIPEGLPPEIRARRDHDKRFLEQLFNPKSIKDYKIPVPLAAELRSYQQAGVNWLRFLYEYQLHGVLCDDMGLGKTLQSAAAVAGAHWERASARLPPLPSLVVCPPTLTGHWVFEVNKFIPSKVLKPLQYVGPPVERERLRTQVKHYNLIVASYDIVRKDIDFFSGIKWNYCILDEGHVIKNGKTKAFKAIKQLVANHRLILSGTPIQNNVLELWSLFDFLMPGLLGTERQFTARYSRPILGARDPKAAPHHLRAGALACEALHRQVLPFLLRRVKEDVLKELPPKITQDYYCELSALQRRLYEHAAREQAVRGGAAQGGHTHVFQALHYLQNVCNHPKLVLSAEHPAFARVAAALQAERSSLDDIHHAAKLPALKQLLLDCGIGASTPDSESEVVVSQHRALVFCQLKKMLDIVEKDLLQKHLPAVTYLRLDGSVPPHQRHAIVTRFNTDVTIDLLLLTTQVGGLGLNLTGADTVIFVEHDWNPMKDLQAMDRAHRIGQRKVVNVYRLITRDTLEEKILGLQKFKLLTANTVISSENAAMETMGTEQLLDLFQLSSQSQPGVSGTPSASAAASASATPGKSVLETLPDLWDDKQYEEEYDMTNFIKSLNKMSA